MVDLSGTNPVSGQEINATDPSDLKGYAIGGIALAAAWTVGNGVVNMVESQTTIADTIGDSVMELS